MAKSWIITVLLSAGAVMSRASYFIVTPLWLDVFKSYNGTPTNTINSTRDGVHREAAGISISFLLIFQWGVGTLIIGITLLFTKLCSPSSVGSMEHSFPKRQFVAIGFAMGISSIMYNYPAPGNRTAPYLAGIIINCYIPIQFVSRFLLLRKKTTLIQLLCAAAILLAEFVCLLPTIFPGMENSEEHHEDGGSTGMGSILWPLCMIISMVPFALSNTLQEKTVQSRLENLTTTRSSSPTETPKRINLIYFQFWYFLFVFITVLLFFWVDLLPRFGTSDDWPTFTHRMAYDSLCVVGLQDGCPVQATVLAWLNVLAALSAGILIPALMRYSDGANFVAVVLTLRTPVVFLFWSLFLEQPFTWLPHIHLSTWLSVGAMLVMLPAVVCYEIGDSLLLRCRHWVIQAKASDTSRLLVNEEEHQQCQVEDTSTPEENKQESYVCLDAA